MKILKRKQRLKKQNKEFHITLVELKYKLEVHQNMHEIVNKRVDIFSNETE